MAKIVNYNVCKNKGDMSLVEYLYEKRNDCQDWIMVRANGTVPVIIPEVSDWLLLVISSEESIDTRIGRLVHNHLGMGQRFPIR
ncbi:MAG: hypothetical protein UX38_C0018G0003 [Microgenomates group bacterium GW2011_GWC1_46_16]|nr:MAG: hypothetical protein UX38_C0018G0003 [Microgenomates group bacterium GW2011_GWC1_46_16]